MLKYSDPKYFCMYLCEMDVMVLEDYYCIHGIIGNDLNMVVWQFQFQSPDLTMIMCIMSISQ